MHMNDMILYLKERRILFLWAFIWVTIFFIMFTLTGVSVNHVWYPALICTVLFCIYAVWDAIRFIKRHRELQRLLNHIDMTLENLPHAETLLEKDYQELIKELNLKKNQNINEILTSRRDAMEYVTLWTHQVKTPLTALQLFSSELTDPAKTEILSRLFEIEQYADMMLQFLRLEGDSMDYVLKEYPIKSMVNQAVRYFARIFISKGISVKIDLAKEAVVVTDEKWMVFVLKQLISNALKYTSKGEIRISMPTFKTLLIEDTGIGIADEDLPRIFERGYTGYNGRMDKKATGLGLFLVKRILTGLNQEIRITSKVNEGTKVFLYFQPAGSCDSGK